MIANATAGIEDLTLLVEQEIHVHASLEDHFEPRCWNNLAPGMRAARERRCR